MGLEAQPETGPPNVPGQYLLDQGSRPATFVAQALALKLKAGPVYLPGWPGIALAVEKMDSGSSGPFVVVTDEGSLFVDPKWQTVEDAYGNDHPYPTNQDVWNMENIQLEPGSNGNGNDDDGNGGDKPAKDPALYIAGAMLALAAWIGMSR